MQMENLSLYLNRNGDIMTEAEYKSDLRAEIVLGIQDAMEYAKEKKSVEELLQLCSLAGGLISEHPQGDKQPVGFQMAMTEVEEHEEYENE